MATSPHSKELAADVIVVGAGLAGLVAASQAYAAGRTVLILDQEPEASLGGQAHWSFGGIFLVNSPEQRHLGVRDSEELAQQDWAGTAGFDRAEDYWPQQWAEAYVSFASGEKRAWLHSLGVRFFPLVQWAERGGYDALGHGNSVPRFHVTWGTGPGVLAPFIDALAAGVANGAVRYAFRHRATELLTSNGMVAGVQGEVLAPSAAARGVESSREVVSSFSATGQAVIVTTGGIGGNHQLVREQWPEHRAPQHMITGVPASTDGLFQQSVASIGAHLINSDRMWHYPEGIHNYAPVWPAHGIRILSGPSPLWLDARGTRFPVPLYPGSDSLGSVRHLETTGFDYSWFVLNKTIIDKEFALSGSEQNPDLTGKDMRLLAKRALPGSVGPVQHFLDHGVDFLTAPTAQGLAAKMNALTSSDLIDGQQLHRLIAARDAQVASGFGKDSQINAIRAARRFATDKLIRVAPLHQMLAPEHGPLIAVRLSVLTRKSLGGLETDLSARV
ncbi:MAG: FAD-binding dehydrogenase, partial [Acidobacteria bacterium]|nr:FAD-binding dehydrogenase [Acidobacteriota bacterium]